MASELPEKAHRLLAAHIDSIEQLEILLLLHRERARTWRPDEIAAELRTAVDSSERRAGELVREGLATAGDGGYRLADRDDVVRATAELAELYRTRRVSVINFIFSKPDDRMKTFADAFKLTKGDRNG